MAFSLRAGDGRRIYRALKAAAPGGKTQTSQSIGFIHSIDHLPLGVGAAW